jgi:uncharacterized protein
MELWMPAAYIAGLLALGAGAGFLSAALGVGGGIIMVPAFLDFIPGMDPHTAKGTSLFVIIFIAAANAFRLHRGSHQRPPWATAAWLASGSVAGAWLGTCLTGMMPPRAVLWMFVGLIVAVAVRTFFLKEVTVREEDVRRRNALSVAIGLAAGVIAGATGIGGGALLVPLALIAGISANARVVALSNMVMIATCTAGALTHALAPQTAELSWTVGQVCYGLAPFLVLGAQAGSILGKKVNTLLTLPRRRLVMGILLLVIVARVAAKALQ